MSNHLDVIRKLQQNSLETYEEASRLLIKIAENILKDRANKKLRTLQKSNTTISTKILKVPGGLDCLILMGFQESRTCLTIPIESSLHMLEFVKNELINNKNNGKSSHVTPHQSTRDQNSKGAVRKERSDKVCKDKPKVPAPPPAQIIRQVVLPPFKPTFSNPFLNQIAFHFHLSQVHDNKILQERARQLIPVLKLEEAALQRLRVLQEGIKKGKIKDIEVSVQDMLILELLAWFKNDFFSWVDSPACEKCGSETTHSHMSTDSNLLQYADRVEMHKCNTCDSFTPFPRYSDLNILMETRRGRCGEWANTFTLFCRSMGWDARHVFDETDHVWTEVYSFAQKRWLHCDSCENACDAPLTYESGWKKPISYVLAYSSDEVQDVTWRYSSNHKDVLKRRTKCTEEELINALLTLRKERQKNFSESKRAYLTKRLLVELCELFLEKKPNDDDLQGRISGSLAWRLSRGEQQEVTEHVWCISDQDAEKGFVSISYSTALDTYEQTNGTESSNVVIKGWHKGAFKASGMMRKEENDWKMVYLARQENNSEGQISWKYTLDSKSKVFDTIQVHFNHKLFETGKVDVNVCGDSAVVQFQSNQQELISADFSGSKTIVISATLTGGKGDVAWQHAQLFRQSLSDDEYPFKVILTFKSVE